MTTRYTQITDDDYANASPEVRAQIAAALSSDAAPASGTQTSVQSSHPVAAMILLATRVVIDTKNQRATLYTGGGFGFHVAFGKRHGYCQFASGLRSPTVFCDPIPNDLIAVLFALAEKKG